MPQCKLNSLKLYLIQRLVFVCVFLIYIPIHILSRLHGLLYLLDAEALQVLAGQLILFAVDQIVYTLFRILSNFNFFFGGIVKE